MTFTVLTIFPEIIADYAAQSILGRAQNAGLFELRAINIRNFARDRHHTVDDAPYGGGPGMILKADVMHSALASLGVLKKNGERKKEKKRLVIVMSPRGRQFDQKMAARFSQLKELVIVSGRYEGIDQRVIDYMVDEEVSIGPYVLAGGELPALSIVEATARLVRGVLGNPASLEQETFGSAADTASDEAPEYPQYTRPEKFMAYVVPEVLLSGDHQKIQSWRQAHIDKARKEC